MRKIKEAQSNKKILKIKTAARFVSTGTQQLYEKGKEEMEKKKNGRFGNYYYWQLKIFFFPPNNENAAFTRVCTSLARNEKKREKNQHNKGMEGVIPIKYPSSDTSFSFLTLPAPQPQSTSNSSPQRKTH